MTRPWTLLNILLLPLHISAQGRHEVETSDGCGLPLDLRDAGEVILRPSVTLGTVAEVKLTARVNVTNGSILLSAKSPVLLANMTGSVDIVSFASAVIHTSATTSWSVTTRQNLSEISCEEPKVDLPPARECVHDRYRYIGGPALNNTTIILVSLLVVSGIINLGLLTYVFVLRVEKTRLMKKKDPSLDIRFQPMAHSSPQPMAPKPNLQPNATFDNTVYNNDSRESAIYDNIMEDTSLYDDIITLKI